MEKLKIACGNSRQARFWKNKVISFDDLCERLKTPVLTSETAEEYRKLPKAQKEEIKDKGGFVGGHLKDGHRQKDKVECRSMLVYDLDSIPEGFLPDIGKHLQNKGCWYTTHSHTPEIPRARAIIPTSRDMTPDEFNAVARYYAADNGFIETLDPCCFLPHQLMYWPTCSSDGEYLFGVLEGEVLDPDAVLASHPEWKDCSLLPTTPKESVALSNKVKRQTDPHKKEGVVGAMCRAYTIQKVIDAYLSDIYEPSANDPNRYDYIPGEGSSGVVIYDDKFAYSHHATDPAGGRLCNAFDLVRIHKFGDLDEKKSFNQMCELALGDDRVKLEILNERREQAAEDFAPDADDAEDPVGLGDPTARVSPDDAKTAETHRDWRLRLTYRKQNAELENSLHNLTLILENDEKLKNIVFNQLADGMEIKGEVPWKHPERFWRDADDSQLVCYVDENYGTFSARNYQIAVTKVVDDRSYHPVRDYFDSLPEWDGIRRVDTLLVDYLGAEDMPYTRAVTRKTLCGAVARIMEPGIKFDNILVLNGDQGIGKTTLISKLGGEWYSDSLSLTDMNDKTAAEKLQGYWIIEIGELAGMKKADIDRVKAFISRQDDKYRASYGRRVTPHPRQCIFFGTTNSKDGYLRDVTGNRRFWNVRLTGDGPKKPWQLTDEDVRQIWAEALVLYKNGEKLYLPPELEDVSRTEQAGAMEKDDREGLVRDYLERLLPESWSKMDIYDRREFINEPDDPTMPQGTVRRKQVSNLEIWCECFGKNKEDIRPCDSYAIASIMSQIEGWERTDLRFVQPIYGRQRVYVRE